MEDLEFEHREIKRLEKILDAAVIRIEMLEHQLDRLERWKDSLPTGENP